MGLFSSSSSRSPSNFYGSSSLSKYSSSGSNSLSSGSNSLSSGSNSLSSGKGSSKSSGIRQSKSNSSGDFSQMGNFAPKLYQIDSQEIKNKHSQYGNESWKNNILEKINKTEESKENAEYLAEQFNISLEEFAYMLGDEELYKKYLLRPIYNPLKVIEYIHKEFGELCKESKELNDDEIKVQINNLNKRKKEILAAKVKFILTDIGINQGITGRVLTNACNLLNKRFPYGALHAGLMVDESIIQWGCGYLGNEIVFPSSDLRSILFSIETENPKKTEKKRSLLITLGAMAASAAIGIPLMMVGGGPFAVFMGGLIAAGGISGGLYYSYVLSWEIKEINEIELNHIAEKCVFYNKRKNYSKFSTNCQKFVNDILEAINAPFNPDGELKNVIEQISKNGYCPFTYKGTEFKSRREFDNYIKNIDFKNLCKDDKKLLLSYKSLYDVRLNIIQKEEKLRELNEEEKLEKEKYITNEEEFWNNLLSNEK